MTEQYTSRKRIRAIYFLGVCALVVIMGSIRSGPVYGKLDFLILENRPWWPEWKMMIIGIMQQGTRTIVTDPITATVLNGVFDQQTRYFRKFRPARLVDVEKIEARNKLYEQLFPKFILPLLVQNSSPSPALSSVMSHDKELQDDEMSRGAGNRIRVTRKNRRRYRCLVNLHGFTPSWVPRENRHWLRVLADTSIWYYHESKRGDSLRDYLKNNPPDNCVVFY